MIKTLLFIIAVGFGLSLLGVPVPFFDVTYHGPSFGPFAEGLLGVGAAIVGLLVAGTVIFAVTTGLIVMAAGLPILILGVILCALFAPLLIPLLILMGIGMAVMCAFGGLFA